MGQIYISSDDELVYVRTKLRQTKVTSVWSGKDRVLQCGMSDTDLAQLIQESHDVDKVAALNREAKYGKVDIPSFTVDTRLTLDRGKLLAQNYIKLQAESTREETSSYRKPLEVQQLAAKAEIAKRFLAGNATAEEEATIAKEAELRGLGETVTELATTQMNKANEFSMVRAVIDGLEKKFSDMVNNATLILDLGTICQNFFDTLGTELDNHYTG